MKEMLSRPWQRGDGVEETAVNSGFKCGNCNGQGKVATQPGNKIAIVDCVNCNGYGVFHLLHVPFWKRVFNFFHP